MARFAVRKEENHHVFHDRNICPSYPPDPGIRGEAVWRGNDAAHKEAGTMEGFHISKRKNEESVIPGE